MNIIGKPTIHPALFFSGKILGYSTWIICLISVIRSYLYNTPMNVVSITSMGIFIMGLLLSGISMINLGSATRLGLPNEETTFKSGGLYKISRNPMYLGFNLITIGSLIYVHNIFVIVMGCYSIFIYHLIIMNEEKFLIKVFGDKYNAYKKNVRRYL